MKNADQYSMYSVYNPPVLHNVPTINAITRKAIEEATMSKAKTIEVSQLGLLRHPLRIAILRAMATSPQGQPLSPKEFAAVDDRAELRNVSYHFRMLRDKGAIVLAFIRPGRGSFEHFYSPDPAFMAKPWVRAAIGQ